MEDPHLIAGKKKGRKPAAKKSTKKGAGIVSDIAHGVGTVADLFGLGKRKGKKTMAEKELAKKEKKVVSELKKANKKLKSQVAKVDRELAKVKKLL